MSKSGHRRLYAQGDILLQPVDDIAADALRPLGTDSDGKIVLQHGERTGHRHVVEGEALLGQTKTPPGVPAQLYVGHLVVTGETAVVAHEEHAPIELAKGTYLVRRQREFTNESVRSERLALD